MIYEFMKWIDLDPTKILRSYDFSLCSQSRQRRFLVSTDKISPNTQPPSLRVPDQKGSKRGSAR